MAKTTYIQDPNNPNASVKQKTYPLSSLLGNNTVYGQKTTAQPKVASAVNVPTKEQQNNLNNVQSAINKTATPTPIIAPTTMPITANTSASLGTNTPTTMPATTTGTSALQNMANQGTLYSQLVQNLANYQTPEALTKAYNVATNLEAGLQAGQNAIMNKPIPLEFQQGQAAALQRDYGPQLTAAKGILEKELAGATLGQQALTSAIGAAAPIQVAPGTTAVSPLTGETVAGGLGGYATYQTAQQVFNTANQYKDAVNAQGQTFTYDQTKTPQENWQDFSTNYLPNSRTYQASLVTSGLSPNIGQGATTTSPILESTQTKTAQDIITTNTKDISNISSAVSAADKNLASLYNIAQQAGINNLASVDLNNIANSVGARFSNEAVLSYRALLSGARSLYSSILESRGMTPTDAGNTAATFVPDNISLSALGGLMTTLKGEASNVISGKQEQVTKASSTISGQGQTGTSETTIGGISFVKDASGNWTVKK